MVLDVYRKNIGVPAKCGSRFLTKTVPYWGEFEFRKSFNDYYDGKYNLGYIIIRNPLSHLKSALKTEILPCYDNKLEIGRILNSFMIKNWGGTHFVPNFCEMIYNKWKQSGWKLNVIDLSDLSKFIEQELHHFEFNKTDYDFHDDINIKLGIYEYKDKEEIWNRCVELFPNKMKRLIEYTNEDVKWFDAILNNDRTLIPKIETIDYPCIQSITLHTGSTIEEAYSKNNQIKIYYMGILGIGTCFYFDELLLTEAPTMFYYDNISEQVFHLNSLSNIGMISKITLRPKRTVTVEKGQKKVYGDDDPLSYTYTLSEPLLENDVLTGELTRVAGESVGSYVISQGTLTNVKYKIIFIGDDFTIIPTKRKLI